jgi:hypothetical protein
MVVGGLGFGWVLADEGTAGTEPAAEGGFKGGDAQLHMLVTQGGSFELLDVLGAEDKIEGVEETVFGADVQEGEDLLVDNAAFAGVGIGALFDAKTFGGHGITIRMD